MDDNNKFTDFLKKSNGQIRVPPLKMNIHVLIKAFANEETTFQELISVLKHYPVIIARLLGLANSSWACPVSPITNIETACIRLGLTLVKSVSLALAIASSFDTTRCPSFDPIRFWMTSMLVAEGGVLLAAKLPDRGVYPADFAQTVQTAGILHNLGLLWLADNLANAMEEALKLTHKDPSFTINQAIESIFGIDYCKVGAWIFKQWELPDEIITVVAQHHDNPYSASVAVPVVLIGAAAGQVADLFHEYCDTAENIHLCRLGIDYEQQNKVFKQLSAKQETTRELAKTLFA